MAQTTLGDVWIPEVFAPYQVLDAVEQTAFVQSGVATTNALFNELANGPGRVTTMPFWNDLDAKIEPNYSNDVYTDIAEPQKLTTGEMVARIADLNEGWGSSDLVGPLSGQDPLRLVAARVDSYWQKQFQRRAIATAVGIYNDNLPANGGTGDMIVDISSADMTVGEGNRISGDAVINGMLTMGDNLDNVGIIAMHSIVYGRLLKDQLIQFVQPAGQTTRVATYLDKRVVVDDGMPIVGGDGAGVAYKYLVIMFAPGVIGYGRGTPKVPSEYERHAARGNGGGFETLWSRKRWVMHPHGYTFTNTVITGPGLTPTWADLRNPVNWERVLERKSVGITFLVVNG